MATKARVIRGVGVRGKYHAEGMILAIVNPPKTQDEISGQEYAELKSSYYVEAYSEPATQAPVTASVPAHSSVAAAPQAPAKKG